MRFNVEGLDKLGDFGDGAFGGMIASLGVLAIFIAIIVSILVIGLWVFGSIGLMNLAKKKNIPNAWLVFVPIGRSYILAKLGFETYGDPNNKNNNTFMWITFGLGIASFVLGKMDNKVYISGRSIGDINVQLILEKLGGGGHLTLAGAQIEDISLQDAKQELINRINEYFFEQEQ